MCKVVAIDVAVEHFWGRWRRRSWRRSDENSGRWFVSAAAKRRDLYYVTYFTMIFAFGAWNYPALFQTGWFVDSLLTQTLIIHIIRTAKIPFLQSWASAALISTSIIICALGVALPFSWMGASLGFVPLPPLYWREGRLRAFDVRFHPATARSSATVTKA
jgi:hypothetical protein